MAKTPSDDEPKTTEANEPPAPEELQLQDDSPSDESDGQATDAAQRAPQPAAPLPKRRPRGSYRPSHKATFIGLGVVVAILAINAIIIGFVLKLGNKVDTQIEQGQVTINQSALEKLGVSNAPVGDAGIKLTVNPDAQFNGDLSVGGNVSVSGQLRLNGTFSAAQGNFTKLEAGETKLESLNVNGKTTVGSLVLRDGLTVPGATRVQGPATFSSLLTVNNSLNVSGNLAVGGLLSVGAFHTGSLTSDGTITVGGHLITRGRAPSVSAGSAVGSNGTVSISGNDMAGTVGVNVGVGAVNGIVAKVTFRNGYSNTPHVVVTAVGAGIGSIYVTRTSNGFNIGVNNALSPGGYAFDYIVAQ